MSFTSVCSWMFAMTVCVPSGSSDAQHSEKALSSGPCKRTFLSCLLSPLFSFTASKTQISHDTDGVPQQIRHSYPFPVELYKSSRFLLWCPQWKPGTSAFSPLQVLRPAACLLGDRWDGDTAADRTCKSLVKTHLLSGPKSSSSSGYPTASSLSSSPQRWFCHQHPRVAACRGQPLSAHSALPCPASPPTSLLTHHLTSRRVAVQLNLWDRVV